MEIPQEIVDQIHDLKSQMYTKGSIVREVKRVTKDKKLAKEYVGYVLGRRQQQLNDNPKKRLSEIKSTLLSSSLTCVGLIGIAVVIHIISNGTFRATGGLALLAIVSGIIAVFKLLQLAYYSVKLSVAEKELPAEGGMDVRLKNSSDRTWEDLQ